MANAQDKPGGLVRVTVKLAPDQYDELFRHVRAIGSNMSAFFRECAVKTMKEQHADVAHSQPGHREP
jgi:hypothetical protein